MSFSIIVEQQYLAFNIHYLFTTDKNSYVSTYLLTYLHNADVIIYTANKSLNSHQGFSGSIELTLVDI